MIYLIIFLLIAAVLIGLYVFIFIKPRNNTPKNKAVLTNYAHRGLHGNGIPENSMQAFELAVEKGYGIELDVQLSKDGTVMVFHDYTLSRMTGCNKKLKELNADELTKLLLAETDQTIPTFKQVLEAVDGKVPLLVELKGEDLNASLCSKVAELLKEYSGAYCVESFNPLLIRNIKKYLPDVYCGQLYTNVCREKKITPLNIILSLMAFNFLAKPDFIAYNKADRNSFPVKLAVNLHKAPKFVWTVKGQNEIEKAEKLGEYSIFEKS